MRCQRKALVGDILSVLARRGTSKLIESVDGDLQVGQTASAVGQIGLGTV